MKVKSYLKINIETLYSVISIIITLLIIVSALHFSDLRLLIIEKSWKNKKEYISKGIISDYKLKFLSADSFSFALQGGL